MNYRETLMTHILKDLKCDEKKSRFGGGVAFYSGKKEIAHFHSDHEIDIRLTRKYIRKLRSELTGYEFNHAPNSAWLAFTFRDKEEMHKAIELVRDAMIFNQ